MSAWGKSRRNFILVIVLCLILVPVATIILSVYYDVPTCFDEKQNGDENGIDCGGSCDLFCDYQTTEPLIHWQRYFEVVPGVYNALAYVENQNIDAKAEDVGYMFKLIDSDGVVLEERIGKITLNPKEIVPILETNLITGKLTATRVKFEFTEDPAWVKGEIKDRVLVVKDEKLYDVNGYPRISGEILNTSVRSVDDISVVVIVYDDRDNAIAVSSTYIRALNKDQSETVIFTWPSEFSTIPNRFEIIPLYEGNL